MSKHPLQFTIIGIGDAEAPSFTPEVFALIRQHKVFSGGLRHRELVSSLLPEGSTWIYIKVPLGEVFAQYQEQDSPILVFASGDPLFFGFTTTLLREFPQTSIKTIPYFNSLQLLAHALVLPYHDMSVGSLTGRPWIELDKLLIARKSKIGLLTDRIHTPATIAQHMLAYGYKHYRMHIGVRLGGSYQEVFSLSLEEAMGREFAHPNCVILEALPELDEFCPQLGIPEQDFHLLNGRAKMITKMPIRLLSLSLLELHRRRVMWDIGFCTGSVSVEAKLQFPHLDIHSFEIRPEGEELILANSQRHGALGINYSIGNFMELDVTHLPAPEAIFIGGHGGELIGIVQKVAQYASPASVLVFNSVSEESLRLFKQAVDKVSWVITQEFTISLDQHNPITLIQAKHL